MSIAFPSSDPTFPGSFPQAHYPSSPGRCSSKSAPCSRPLDSKTSQAYGFKRLVPLLEFPAFGAGILACTFFFFIAFLSDFLLVNITPTILGIVVTISTVGLLALIILILFLL